MGAVNHIIHRVNLEIEAPDLPTAKRLQETSVLLLKNEILVELEKYLDSLALGEDYYVLSQLNLKIENLDARLFETGFAAIAIRDFQQNVDKIVFPADNIKNGDMVKYTAEQMAFESFLYFIETGRLPWFCANSGVLIQEESFLEIKSFFIPEFQERLINLIIANNVAFERLLLQFSGNFIVQLISLIVSGRSGLKADLIPTEKAVVTVQVPLNEPLKERVTEMTDILHRILKKLESDHAFASLPVRKLQCDFLRKAIQKIIFLNEPLNHESIHLLLEEMKSNALKYYSGESGSLFEDKIKGNMVFLESQEKKLPEKLQKEKDDFFVQHAGLVLLHPFLEYFFKDFNLLKDGQFRNRDAQIMGVHLLHFLATKDELAAEHAMLFEKFLCGVEPGDPIDRFITLSQEMKDEGENLLRAVIGHWKALKNTSPDGLREGFLQRDGSLALDDFQNRLIVESKAQDVLLSFLPWGFSYFKLPWMECALNVEWQQAF